MDFKTNKYGILPQIVLSSPSHQSTPSRMNKKRGAKSSKKQWKFSDHLSEEGRLAMELAREDSNLLKVKACKERDKEVAKQADLQSDFNKETDLVSDKDSALPSTSVTTSNQTISSSQRSNSAKPESKQELSQSNTDSANGSISLGPSFESNKNNNSNTNLSPNGSRNRDKSLARLPSAVFSVKSSSAASTFSDIYARKSSMRMRMDITDSNFDWNKERKKPLSGCKLESTLEMVEIVNAEDDINKQKEEERMQELIKLNSIDKCMVWMESNGEFQYTRDSFNDD